MTRGPRDTAFGEVTGKYSPYPAYKDSGVEWLGEIPAHWEVKRTRHVARLESGHTPSRSNSKYWQDCNIPWFTLADVWQIREGEKDVVTETKEKISEMGLAHSSARLLPKGTVILSRTASVGFSAIAGVDMATTQDYVNWVCTSELRPEYLLLVFRSMNSEFQRLTMGSTHRTIYMPDVRSFSAPLPPFEEQTQIVKFVRVETTKLDALVAKKERLIELLREKRTALITRAVTNGLDPDVPMKDSGVEWLGKIPEHWDTKKNQWIFRESNFRSIYGDEELLTVSHITGVTRRTEKPDVAMIEAESHEGYKLCGAGDLAINTMWAWMGALGVAFEDGMVSPSYNVFHINWNDLISEYFDYLSRIPTHVAEITRHSKGVWSSRLRLYPDAFGSIMTPLPPKVEQRDIADYLDSETAKIDALVAKVREAIHRLMELRSALISAAVTGKIDVRETAA